MQNFVNDNYNPNINFFNQIEDPSQSEAFNKATHPSDKPIISKHIFAVDSRQRNYDFYPHANNYNIPIPDRYRNVTSIELKAAMLPRTEYNVNGSNKYIDFNVGDFINEIFTINNPKILKNGKPFTNVALSDVPLNISEPILGGTHTPAQVTVDLDSNSKIVPGSYKVVVPGSGYVQSKPPRVSLGDYSDFTVKIGLNYVAELREGQYVIGGNPQFRDNSGGDPTNLYASWVPSHLLNEIESALSYAILQDSSYCYQRRSYLETDTTSTSFPEKDYPLLFTCRLMSQYPTLDSYKTSITTPQVGPENYETNSCRYNRIYTTNCLILKFKNTSMTTFPSGDPTGNIFSDVAGFRYNILKYHKIGGPTDDYIVFLELQKPRTMVGGSFWSGIEITGSLKSTAWTITDYEICHWEYLFATGENQVINSASLLGYNKKNYYLSTENDPIEIESFGTKKQSVTLVPQGLTYSSENDYYLFGDPEYVILSFRPKFGGNTISGINDRVQSQPSSNIDRVFACLIYDTVQPAVLQDVGSGKIESTINSIGYTNNNLNSFLSKDKKFDSVQQLTGNSGSQNMNYNKPPGQLKAMKGADFDRKIIEFPQPIAQIFDINIRFSKFCKDMGQGTEDELYNFHGKEHLLLFEITCGDLKTGRRF